MAVESVAGVQFGSGDFYDYILNDMYLPSVADTVINPNELLRALPRDKTRIEGKNVVYPIHTGRNLGGNAISPGGNLPDPGTQQFAQYSFPCRHIYHRIKFDGITMDASARDVASWLEVVDTEVKGASMDMSRRRNRIFNGDGSGRLAEITSVDDGTTLTIEINSDIEGASLVPTTDFAPTKFFTAGMRFAALTSAGASMVVSTVTSVDDAVTLTVGDTTGMAANDWLVEVSSETSTTSTDTAYQAEPMGLAGMFSDADPNDGVTGFQGVDSTAAGAEWHLANVLDDGSALRPLTEALLQSAFSTAIEVGEAELGALFSSFGMMNTYSNLLIKDKRFVNTLTLMGGSKVITFNEMPWIVDRDCYTNRVYFVDWGNIRVYVLSDPKWMDFDGSAYSRMQDQDAYQATLLCREQLGCDVRDKCTLLGDITQS